MANNKEKITIKNTPDGVSKLINKNH
jgi:hypothetical protein